jgi:hypothetical protein
MAVLANTYFKLETLETLVKTLKAKGEAGIGIDFSINDTTNEYGSNVSAYVSQSEDERKAKKPRFYVANGRVFWTDGNVSVAEKVERQSKVAEPVVEDSGLPF